MDNLFQGWLITMASAELLLLLTRGSDLKVLAKHEKQRTHLERLQVGRGLGRSVVIEAFLLVPASVALFNLTLLPIVLLYLSQISLPPSSIYALAGVASYGFPFTGVKKIVRTVALKTLQEFASLIPEEAKGGKDGDQ